jgi:hypothetical protein
MITGVNTGSHTINLIQQDLAFHQRVLFNLRARSQALDARLRNEINLVGRMNLIRELRIDCS